MKLFYTRDVPILRDLAKAGNAEKLNQREFFSRPERFTGSTILTKDLSDRNVIYFCKKHGIDYYNLDNPYLNNLTRYHFNGYFDIDYIDNRWFYRITKNGMQLNSLIDRDNKRFKLYQKTMKRKTGVSWSQVIKKWNNKGSDILICPPSKTSCKFYGINSDDWTKEVILKIKKVSNRKIRIREKPRKRETKFIKNTIYDVLDKNIFILVTYNSMTSIDAIIHGIPVLTLGENAAAPISLNNIRDIENPIYPDRKKWLYHLSYGQFTLDEIKNGKALSLLGSLK